MLKRRLGAALNARSCWSRDHALMLKVITHNIMIICSAGRGFLQSNPDTLAAPFSALSAGA